jgi:hypothetical protein
VSQSKLKRKCGECRSESDDRNSVDYSMSAKAQTGGDRNAKATRSGFTVEICGTLLSVPPFVPAHAGTNEIAYEDIMINAAEYRAMASEHHRLAGMCRSPESREQHFRLEKDFLALAASEECLHGTRAAQHPSHSESAG